MKLDILAFGAHPDDVELSCGGTLLLHNSLGKKTGIVDLTQGQLGTRGTPEIRLQEAEAAAEILNVQIRENLGFDDGFFKNDTEHQMEVIRMIRKYMPDIIIANAVSDRHPDHGRAAKLVAEAAFLSGLEKIETNDQDVKQEKWRPKVVLNYIQANHIEPDVVVDISDFMEQKMKAVKAYKSQFFDPESKDPATFISSPEFMESIKARALLYGMSIGVEYGEGFVSGRRVGVRDLSNLV